jgi:hypothetical protein
VAEEGVPGVKYSPSRVVVVLALLLALGSFGMVEIINPAKLLDWFIEFAATLAAATLAVAGGIWLFHYQTRKTEAQLRKKLLTRVALEWKRNLDRLERGVTTPFVRQKRGETTREHLGEIVTAELSTIALSDLIRSDAFEPEEVIRAMRLEARINAYMYDVEFLLGHLQPEVSSEMLRSTLADLNARRGLLLDDLRALLQALRDQGIEVPD